MLNSRPSIPPASPVQVRAASNETDDAMSGYKEALRDYFPSKDQILAEARALTAKQKRRKALAVQLSLVGCVGLLWGMDPAWKQEELVTAIGERASYTMADGSLLELNTGTHAVVETRLRSRRIRLEAGEAQFTVAHQWRPFVVQAGDTRIRDIGTVFNVQLDGRGETRVAVVEGAVEVSRGASLHVLHAGEQTLSSADGLSSPKTASLEAVTAWQKGLLQFDGTPLSDVLAEIGRYRAAPVVLQDAGAGKLRLSGVYDIQKIESLIDTLPVSLAVSVQRRPDGSVLVASRSGR